MIRIEKPDGGSIERPRPQDPSQLLTNWLEQQQIPLNTRCGGRGFCQGCLVEIEGITLRACQTDCQSISSIRIPTSSLRDHSLSGVSIFEIDGPAPQSLPRPGLGLALDIGTTTVAAALWDLKNGVCLAHGALANEQRRYGDNVLSRIDHAVSMGGGSAKLQSALIDETIQPLIDRLCRQASRCSEEIAEAVAAGNTVMLHSLAGSSLSGFAAYPFKPEFLTARTLSARSLGLDADFSILCGHNLGPFVGADIALGAYACGMTSKSETALLIDFGTNGEILLKHPGGTLATATAAGPAFEGGRLRYGAPAHDGVVSALQRQPQSWQISICGGGKASAKTRALSGAAYIDFLALALRDGILSPMGRMNPQHPEVKPVGTADQNGYGVAVTSRISVTETDVAELIQAKAAIAAGVTTLLEVAGLSVNAIQTLYIAGGFGYHLNIAHAIAIGMLPNLSAERIKIIGNASLGGASRLLQTQDDTDLQDLAAHTRVIELNQINSFEDHFIDAMPLQPTN
ncbi:MAG: DUF4445 domain-containing protein [Opitutales bacterium]|nr:DUF4445 domain-containing protein [Opitutales bacterium]